MKDFVMCTISLVDQSLENIELKSPLSFIVCGILHLHVSCKKVKKKYVKRNRNQPFAQHFIWVTSTYFSPIYFYSNKHWRNINGVSCIGEIALIVLHRTSSSLHLTLTYKCTAPVHHSCKLESVYSNQIRTI